MPELTLPIGSEADTRRLGRALAATLPAGTVISLVGALGAGKTRLVQAAAEALGVPRESVTSPTFVLVHEYRGGRLPVFHFDAYRLADEDEFLQLGPEESFDGAGLTFVEWGDRVTRCLPDDALEVRIDVLEGERRRVTLSAPSSAVIEAIAQHWKQPEVW